MTKNRKNTTTTDVKHGHGHGTMVAYRAAGVRVNTQIAGQADTVLLRGKYIEVGAGKSQVMLSVNPTEVQRTLAVRQLNQRLEGRATKSNTVTVTRSEK